MTQEEAFDEVRLMGRSARAAQLRAYLLGAEEQAGWRKYDPCVPPSPPLQSSPDGTDVYMGLNIFKIEKVDLGAALLVVCFLVAHSPPPEVFTMSSFVLRLLVTLSCGR